ncbi:MAG: tRNA pseudouridine(55) synthase TruB [Bacteroidetes bacterium]|jgi:tRNA pseudouridine55 synthase|nr:tRNA pseudouridine(55) synthase TruB [Bacteroidota bacterium]
MNDSVLFIDKPIDWTSFDVVKKVRSVFHLRKVGHAGTLDPKATGLLIVCTGSKTKDINQYVGLEKEYVGVMELGVQTPSYDSETEVVEYHPYDNISNEQIYNIAQKFVGTQTQVPPMYSAVKYGGKPLYRFARQGKELPRIERTIMIFSFEITSIGLPFVDFHVVCSKGTYIRSLVNDFGNTLGCGATLRSLRRTRIGSFSVDSAVTISALESLSLINRGEQ